MQRSPRALIHCTLQSSNLQIACTRHPGHTHTASQQSRKQPQPQPPQDEATMALEAATAPRALLAACLVLLVLGGSTGPSSVLRGAGAQAGGQCLPQLNRLLACRAYLVPGAPDPSADCCSALSAVSHECACSTMGIINSLPGRCHLAQANCSA
ncbi:Non-specific lipid-transfer protein C4 [Zea mays]|uniref:Non-specific lipid-transfer protein C4 n=1 Tax=Zea mays TaxID=4577 RepID=A0A3L6F8X1_MAIZE|nr:Non-specific lipid-transfer protein C4 [Zea mays]